jgi:hypothetical protein
MNTAVLFCLRTWLLPDKWSFLGFLQVLTCDWSMKLTLASNGEAEVGTHSSWFSQDGLGFMCFEEFVSVYL